MFRTSIPGPSPIGPVASVTSNFNLPKVMSHVGPTSGLGRVLLCKLYIMPRIEVLFVHVYGRRLTAFPCMLRSLIPKPVKGQFVRTCVREIHTRSTVCFWQTKGGLDVR